jgi:hypothetical protein
MEEEYNECGFCGDELEEDHLKIQGQMFCSSDHAQKWKNAQEMKSNGKHCC